MGRNRKTKKMKKCKRGTRKANKIQKRHFIKDKCAPKTDTAVKNKFSCYTRSSLHKLKELWNARHQDNPIKSNDSLEIWKALKYGLSRSCKRESCWLKQKIFQHGLTNEMKNYTFAPKPPKEWVKKPYEWLTSVELTNIMKQYENTYKCFEFMGPAPADAESHKMFGECVWEDICQFDIIDLIRRGKRKIGIIFNLDPHYLEGSHWIAVFIDISKGAIYYFDSYGETPPKRVKKFMERIRKQSKKLKNPLKIIQNKRRHQYSESECGMYCLYVIIQLLKGKDFNELTKTRIPDKFIKKLRKTYFN